MITRLIEQNSSPIPPFTLRRPPIVANHQLLVRSSALFEGLAEWEYGELLFHAQVRIFARNEPLFSQGQRVRSLILLEAGGVKHTQVSLNGHEVLLRLCKRGDIVNVLTGSELCTHTCSAWATEKCAALVWEYGRISRLLNEWPRMRENVSRILAGHLRELEERFREMATENVARRLALLITRLAAQIGVSTAEGILVSLSREELAQMAGATVFTVSRLLAAWSARGLVISRRAAIIVCDPDDLSAEAE